MQERRNSIANALELSLIGTYPMIYQHSISKLLSLLNAAFLTDNLTGIIFYFSFFTQEAATALVVGIPNNLYSSWNIKDHGICAVKLVYFFKET